MNNNLTTHRALKFVVLLGLVSLFADISYEGARSITGQYLQVLGASGTVVGIVAGLGEFIGYGFRLVSGILSDKTKRYWSITFFGYALSLIAVPLLALAGNWQVASLLIILERLGKAIRNPARDTMLSYATKKMGRGWGFGLHEALDQIGAITGPLLISAVLYYKGSYPFSFAVLLIPSFCALSVLGAARFLYPRPEELEGAVPQVQAKGFSKKYWLYIAAVSCIAAGYVDFALIAYHFEKVDAMPKVWIPLLFSIAQAAAALSSLLFGKLYDIKGISIMIFSTALSSLFAPLVFLDGFYYALLGMLLWGVGLGAQESIMRAFVAHLVPINKRGTAYGTLNIWFGISWFAGSALMGFLYDVSLIGLIAFSVASQLAAIPLLFTLLGKK